MDSDPIIDRLTALMNELANASEAHKPRIIQRIHTLKHGIDQLQQFLDRLRKGDLCPDDIQE